MLVLTRKKDESIIISDNISVKILDIDGDRVKLGVDAPKEVPVFRKEVYEAILAENVTAAGVKPEEISGLAAMLSKMNAGD